MSDWNMVDNILGIILQRFSCNSSSIQEIRNQSIQVINKASFLSIKTIIQYPQQQKIVLILTHSQGFLNFNRKAFLLIRINPIIYALNKIIVSDYCIIQGQKHYFFLGQIGLINLNIFQMIRGTTHDQDARFSNKQKKMLQKSEWPDKYDIKVDLTKVDLELIKTWIQKKLIVLLGEEDDVVSGTIISIIDDNLQKQQRLNAKTFHVAISGFLLQKTLTFVSELWDLLDQAQRSARGIPQSLLQEKKRSEELQRKKIEELNAKRYKINNHKFNNVVKRFTNNRNSPQNRYRQQRSEKSHKGKKDRSRSRSNKRKKQKEQKRRHRSRSRQSKQKKSRQNEDRYRRYKKSPSNQRPPNKALSKRKRDASSSKSDSSGVVSSSNSHND